MTVVAAPLTSLPSEESPPRWHDPKRYLWVLGTAMPLLPFVAMGAHARTGHGADRVDVFPCHVLSGHDAAPWW